MENFKDFDFVPLAGCRRAAAGGTSVLVIAPHPDDDVIGMGGAMRLFAEEGKRVFSVYITSGQADEAATRRAEAIAALKVVKASGAFFLNFKSSALGGAAAGAAARELRRILCRLEPAELYLPSPFELHPTHRRAIRIALRALRMKLPAPPQLWCYSVWGGIYGLPQARAVDISRHVAIKKKAIRQHVSQTAVKPYDRGALGRNAYEGIFLHTHAPLRSIAAEIFIPLDFGTLSGWIENLKKSIRDIETILPASGRALPKTRLCAHRNE